MMSTASMICKCEQLEKRATKEANSHLSQNGNELGASISELIEATVRERRIKVGKHDNEVVQACEDRYMSETS